MIFKPAMTPAREQRFWMKVDKCGECWNWTGTTRDGYGLFRTIMGMRSANRIAWELHFGRIPEGQQCLHRCDNRRCVNPNHLFLGTLQDNMDDRNNKERQAKGERCGRATISAEVAAQIKALKPTGRAPWGACREVAKQFGIQDKQTVYSIWAGKTWRHL